MDSDAVQANLEASPYTQKNAGLNTTQHWVKYGQTQRLGCFDPVVGFTAQKFGLNI